MYYIVHFSVIGRKTSNLQLMSVMPEPGGGGGQGGHCPPQYLADQLTLF